jgi:hypothetical protein
MGWLAILLGLGAAGVALWRIQPDPIDPSTGSDYTQPTMLNGDGVVTTDGTNPAPPESLAAGLEYEVNRYSMARAIVSEVSGLGLDAQIGVAWAIRNMAAHQGVSVLRLVTRAVDSSGSAIDGLDGFYGRQRHRYCSTAQDADQNAYDIADQVMSGDVPDPTGGARQWDSPGAFAALGEADDTAKREAAGLRAVSIPGVSINSLRFWVDA